MNERNKEIVGEFEDEFYDEIATRELEAAGINVTKHKDNESVIIHFHSKIKQYI